MSTIPDAIDLLHQLLEQADYPYPPPQVAYGMPIGGLEDLVVLIGDGSGDEEWGAIGNKRRDEEYTLNLFIGSAWPGDDALDAKDRAWAIWQVIDDVLAENSRNFRDNARGVLFTQPVATQFGPTVEDEGAGHTINAVVRFNGTT